jgi:cytochrome c nitrite reductase small subunit
MTKVSAPRTANTVLKVATAVLIGTAVGSGVFAVNYSEAVSYLGNDPATCTNCHVMQGHFDAWEQGSHATVATCNDCHLPHDSVIDKYLVKAEDGVLHASAFTFQTYPENIVIRDKSLAVTEASCIYCHGSMTDSMMYTLKDNESISCVRCHSGVGHSKEPA